MKIKPDESGAFGFELEVRTDNNIVTLMYTLKPHLTSVIAIFQHDIGHQNTMQSITFRFVHTLTG